ncbi:amino acid ABC transporter permease [Agrobacterium rhizogenes]|uniref:amino acid ABC transporter permease n=1 Tax=Rhizobium rhizogenes TaxID=359 RepID=UPI0004D4CA1A|nr:amino acid ABC transporter permease [Rhizobium rhizogenes]KAA6487901.1 amino acid ABC transporter permease [Agrobacterium sp. ICMP 7243]OCJ23111.1 amino acid ABC transporter [Agrobacterium sp. B133/95]KEA08309.1 amino acid ABC transporter [Rhizobium rhizogenes]MQB31417.1 amino acid ABC transporter permease [Rhizobium rhizogenes]NTF51223.1 amino acid ABC transporter permease [Rhizobium rhizogenes]
MDRTLAGVWPALLDGLLTTVTVSFSALLLGVPLAVLLAAASRSGWLLHATAGLYVSFWRGTPILVQLLVIFYLLPFLGLELEPPVAAALALALNTAAFQSEIYRAGLLAVPRGQIEAAEMLGLTAAQTFLCIEVPQAVRTMLPALVGEMQALVKNSSLVSVIAVMDVTRRAQQVAASTFRPLEAYASALLLYVAVGAALAGIGLLMERRLTQGARR